MLIIWRQFGHSTVLLSHMAKSGPPRIEMPIGTRFGRLTLVECAGPGRTSRTIRYKCVCDCGAIRIVAGPNLRYGKTRSCGCLASEMSSERNRQNITHGQTRSLAYASWAAMKQRCRTNTRKSYGYRGVTVCERWLHSFENFLADMGPRPGKQYSIDRISVDGHYEPGNCRWATWKQQAANRRRACACPHCDYHRKRDNALVPESHGIGTGGVGGVAG
jgi:hypothetical protein